MDMMPADARNRGLVRAEWQKVLFAERPRRIDLARLAPSALAPLQPVRLKVLRNHPFEFVASALAPFCAFAGIEPIVTIGAYDDSLSQVEGDADVALIWLDFMRYSARFDDASGLARWLASRVAALRAGFSGPVIVCDQPALSIDEQAQAQAINDALAESASALAGVHVAPLSAALLPLGTAAADARGATTGSRLGDRAFIEAARHLGLRWLPASVRPRIKAVCVDLDHTLYHGVLGEDGPAQVVLTPAHATLQRRLVELHRDGVFLAVVSRNEMSDVERLFDQRSDFPLRLEHVSAWAVSWAPKFEGVIDVARSLRIGIDSMLMVDDNAGEIAALALAVPQLNTLHASPDAAETLAAIDGFPGVFAWRTSSADALRTADLAATATRDSLKARAISRDDYLRSLAVELEFARPSGAALLRAHELSIKTNQFNLALARLSEAEVARRADAADSAVVTVALRDRLSDSGVIGLIVARRAGDDLVVVDLCISCRALGRDLEDVMVAEAIAPLCAQWRARRVGFAWAKGPRNRPALYWLKGFAALGDGGFDADGGIVWTEVPQNSTSLPVRISWQS